MNASTITFPGQPKPLHAAEVPFAPQRTSRFYSAADLDGKPVPQRQWLVHDLVPMKTVTLFGGDGGTGKSLAALQLAVSAATGRAWLNEALPKGRAIFLSAEDDDDELHYRLDAICRAMGLRLADLGGLTIRSLAGEDALLAVETNIALMQTALFEAIEARTGAAGDCAGRIGAVELPQPEPQRAGQYRRSVGAGHGGRMAGQRGRPRRSARP